MDTVEKRAAGEVLSVRDETRLRNHQLRMMRRAFLNDMVVSPREPLYPQNNILAGQKFMNAWQRGIYYYKSIGARAFVPKTRNWLYKAVLFNESHYGNLSKIPSLAAYGVWRALGVCGILAPIYLIVSLVKEDYALKRYASVFGLLPEWAAIHTKLAARTRVYPTDATFTTRLRNVEWGHDAFMVATNSATPRMNPDAVTYPQGTRMNWVTWAPILPEDNDLETADYGNGPGGKGNMTETYRLIHMTKARGLYAKTNPDDIHTPFSGFWNSIWRPIMTGDKLEQPEK